MVLSIGSEVGRADLAIDWHSCIQCSLVTWLLSHPGRAESGQLSGSHRPAGDAPAPIHIAQALEWARVSARAPDRTWRGFPGCTAQLHRSLTPDNCGGWVGSMYCGSGFGIQERLHQVSRVSRRVLMVTAREDRRGVPLVVISSGLPSENAAAPRSVVQAQGGDTIQRQDESTRCIAPCTQFWPRHQRSLRPHTGWWWRPTSHSLRCLPRPQHPERGRDAR